MQIKIIILLYILMIGSIYAQIDTTEWYPLQIGNKWEYTHGYITDSYEYTVEVIGDTVMPNGKNYFILTGSAHKFQRAEDSSYIYYYSPLDSLEYLLYDFISKDRSFLRGAYGMFWGIESTQNEFNLLLQKNSIIKLFDWAIVDTLENKIDTTWNAVLEVYATKITKGLGVTSYDYGDMLLYDGLVGCVVNGDTLGNLTSIKYENGELTSFKLYQNYPNPFNPSTQIKLSVPERGLYRLIVYNVLGQEVATLLNDQIRAGTYTFTFDASKLSAGIYFYNFSGNSFSQTKKMMLMK